MNTNYVIFDKISIGIFIIDSHYRVLFWNKVLESWTGISRKIIVGKDICGFFEKFQDEKIRSRLDSVFSFGAPVIFSSQLHKYTIPSRLPNGRYRLQQTMVTSIEDEKNKGIFHAIFSIQDVSDLTEKAIQYKHMNKQIEIKNRQLILTRERLIKSENNLQQMVDFTNDAVVIIQNNLFVYFNKAFVEMLKSDIQSLADLTFEDLQSEEFTINFATLTKMVHSGKIYKVQLDLTDQKNNTINVEAKFQKTTYKGKKAVLGIFMDISEKITLLKLLQKEESDNIKKGKLITICASCHHVKEFDGEKYTWVSIENYLSTISGKEISHGICNHCFKEKYPDYYEKYSQTHKSSHKSDDGSKKNKKNF
ncbi:MAG: PAS domain S-box protein [Candidatus Marinimicrobia bacterium]|nr:PAS domain S-box protein [Candidatus Neomarinimicrobiota bacterium]